MVIMITGASHTGKTTLAQQLLEQLHFPYLSIDHLKMGLIRSGMLDLTPEQDEELTDRLWPIVREMIKTAIENEQNLIVEGLYVPNDWAKDFDKNYLEQIECICLVMTEKYIRNHFDDIKRYANTTEKRVNDDYCTLKNLTEDNARFADFARQKGVRAVVADEKYDINSVCLKENTDFFEKRY